MDLHLELLGQHLMEGYSGMHLKTSWEALPQTLVLITHSMLSYYALSWQLSRQLLEDETFFGLRQIFNWLRWHLRTLICSLEAK